LFTCLPSLAACTPLFRSLPSGPVSVNSAPARALPSSSTFFQLSAPGICSLMIWQATIASVSPVSVSSKPSAMFFVPISRPSAVQTALAPDCGCSRYPSCCSSQPCPPSARLLGLKLTAPSALVVFSTPSTEPGDEIAQPSPRYTSVFSPCSPAPGSVSLVTLRDPRQLFVAISRSCSVSPE